MENVLSPGLLDERDGLNPTRALILHAYYGLRRTRVPTQIGTSDIVGWIKDNAPGESLPSTSLILLTLGHAKLVHRPPGRPRHDGPVSASASPFLRAQRPCPPDPGQR